MSSTAHPLQNSIFPSIPAPDRLAGMVTAEWLTRVCNRNQGTRPSPALTGLSRPQPASAGPQGSPSGAKTAGRIPAVKSGVRKENGRRSVTASSLFVHEPLKSFKTQPNRVNALTPKSEPSTTSPPLSLNLGSNLVLDICEFFQLLTSSSHFFSLNVSYRTHRISELSTWHSHSRP
jgi:hypothetical protein